MDNDTTTVQAEVTPEMVDSLLEPAQQEPEQPAQEPEQPAEDPRKSELNAALNELIEDGWTVDELQALILDEKVRADIAAGKSLMRAVNAYERRQKAAAATAPAKKGVPNVRAASAANTMDVNRFADMTDEEFAKHYEKTKSDALAGKKIRL